MTVVVEAVYEPSNEVAVALAHLIPQLSPAVTTPDLTQLVELLSSPAVTLLVARIDGDEIVGTLTLVVAPTPTRVHAWIEDVVVDQAARGRGVGKPLVAEALRLAEAKGAQTVDLTSHESREAANALYQRLGFQLCDTNVYRYSP